VPAWPRLAQYRPLGPRCQAWASVCVGMFVCGPTGGAERNGQTMTVSRCRERRRRAVSLWSPRHSCGILWFTSRIARGTETSRSEGTNE
jgi:hypothetical protein